MSAEDTNTSLRQLQRGQKLNRPAMPEEKAKDLPKRSGLKNPFANISPIAFIAALLIALANALFFVDFVKVSDSFGITRHIATFSHSPDYIVEKAGLEPLDNAKVSYTKSFFTASVYVDNYFTVKVNADGLTQEFKTDSGQVTDALMALGLDIGPYDIVDPPIYSPLKRGMAIKLSRVDYVEESVRLQVSDKDIEAYVASLPKAKKESFSKSRSSIYDIERRVEYIDGKRQETSEITSVKAVAHPYDAPNSDLFTGKPLSSIDGFIGVELGPDGLPSSYKRVMKGAVCTAYSAENGRGSSGLGLFCGTVAVNSKEIKYGTRLFIISSDKKFVYGYAIATDTGGAMMNGSVDIDLYFETNRECNAFGKRRLDVYILD